MRTEAARWSVVGRALVVGAALASCSDTQRHTSDAAVDAEPAVPGVFAVVPYNKQVGVPTDIRLVARFNKPVTGVSATTFTLTLRDASSSVPATVSYDPERRVAYLEPDVPLLASRAYDAQLGSDITDVHGHALTGMTRWSFLTANDATPPMVTARSPLSDTSDVVVDTTVQVTFSEPVANLSASSFLVDGPAGMVAGTIGYVSQTSVQFTPTVQLAPYATHTVTLTSAITDVGGNQLVGAPITWAFTTGADAVAPMLVSRNPPEDETDVAATTIVTARFSEPVVGISGTTMFLEHAEAPVPATVTYIPSTRTARLVPDAPLASGTTYTVTLTDAISDASGNALAGAPHRWMFATEP